MASRALHTQRGAECSDDPAGPPAGGSTVLAAVRRCPSSDLPGDGQVLIVDEKASIFQSGKIQSDHKEEGLLIDRL